MSCVPAGWALALALAASPLAAAEVYRWVDADGRVHYGDRPPAAADADVVRTRPAPDAADPDTAARRDRGRRVLEAYTKTRRERSDARAAEQAAKEQHARDCARLTREIEQSRTARFLYRPGAGDDLDVLSEAERAAYVGRLEARARRLRC